jgi:23S rRNA-/tRNA-specific pseudouridylate synthase
VAKEKPTLEALLADLQDHKIEKVYHALVSGKPPKEADTIRARLLRIEDARDEAKVRVDETGQSAVTHYTLIQNVKSKIQ